MTDRCPKCGEEEHWYPSARIDPDDLWVARFGGPKAKPQMSLKGGHCLACNYEEADVYPDEAIQKAAG